MAEPRTPRDPFGEGDSTRDSGEPVHDIVARYLDRINRGETIDPLEVVTEHPSASEDILEQLSAFIGLGTGKEGDVPLGSFGDYTLRRRIGRGGMGIVYEAWEKSLGRSVALKVLPPGIAADPRASARFLREAQATARLSHPHVVSVFAMGVSQGQPYYAMELVEGETLAQRLEREKEKGSTKTPESLCRLAEVFAGAAEGLHHAHSKGVVHRDIKPSNLILDKEDRLRILDFGLAHLEGQTTLTATGEFLGTPLYMSPEQAMAHRVKVDHRTDIYSLGATLYEAIAGRSPFEGKDYKDTLSQIITRDPTPPSRLRSGLARDLETIVLKCLRKDPEDRYGTAEALAQDLRRFARGDAIEARPQSTWERLRSRARRERLRLAIAGAFLALAVFALIFFLANRASERERLLAEYETKVRAAAASLPSILGMYPVGEEVPGLFVDTAGGAVRLSAIGKMERSSKELEAEIHSVPDRPDAYYFLARAFTGLGKFEESRRVIAEAQRIFPSLSYFQFAEIERLNASGMIDEAATLRSRMISHSKAEWIPLRLEAERAFLDRRFSDAVRSYEAVLKSQAKEKEPYFGFLAEMRLARGRSLLEAGEVFSSLIDFAAAHALSPDHPEPVLFAGKAAYLLGQPKMTEALFREFYESSPENDSFPLAAAWIYASLEDLEKWEEWAKRLKSPSVRERVLADLHFAKGDLQESYDHMQRSLKADPFDETSVLAFSVFLKNLGRIEEALDVLRKAREKHPRSALILSYLGIWLKVNGNVTEAREVCDEALRINPNCVFAHNALGAIFTTTGDLNQAREHFNRAIRLWPWLAFASSEKGFYLQFVGAFEESLSAIDEAIQKKSNLSYPHEFKGYLLNRLGRRSEAMEEYRTTARMLPFTLNYGDSIAVELERAGDLPAAAEERLRLLRRYLHDAITLSFWQPGDSLRKLFLLLARRPDALPEKGWEELRGLLEKPPGEISNFESFRWALLAIARRRAGGPKGDEEALELSMKGLEATENSYQSLRGDQVQALSALFVSEIDSSIRWKEVIERSPRLLPYAVVEELLEGINKIEAVDVERWIESVSSKATDAVSRWRLDFIRGRLYESESRFVDAVSILAPLATTDLSRPEPSHALARCLRALRKAPEAMEALERVLRKSPPAEKDLWTLWAAIGLKDRSLAPEQLSAQMPSLLEGKSSDARENIAWLLQRLAKGEPLRIDCGSSYSYASGWSELAEWTAPDGTVWSKDRFSLGGSTWQDFNGDFAGTDADLIYRWYRSFPEDHARRAAYRIPLPPGRYRVTLHFAETRWIAAGLRRFAVEVEGKRVLEDFDPFRAGYATAQTTIVETEVEDGDLEIRFVRGAEGDPMISAIEVERR